MDTVERTESATVEMYDGFISYSHAADGLLAPRLQAGLQRFAKPWWKRRAVRIFRDESSLAANPHLWSSITDALEASDWFVLLLSPDAATSEWVGKEIEHWKATKPADRILPVVTDGEFGWSGRDVTGSSVPDALFGVFSEEPRWVDLRFARTEEHLDLQNPRFSAAIADIASAIRGVPKDELESEEVRQHRRTVRTAWAAGALVTVLAIASVGFGVQSSRNAVEAQRQAHIAAENESTARAEAERADRNAATAEDNAAAEAEARAAADTNAQLANARGLAAAAISRLSSDPELATLLAVAAIDSAPKGTDQPPEVINALWRAGQSNRLVDSIETGFGGPVPISLSSDGRQLVVVSEEAATVQMYDALTRELVWTYTEDTVDSFTISDISIDGRVAVSVLDSSAAATIREVDGVSDDLPARVLILDGNNGTLIHVIEFPNCPSAEVPTWSPEGQLLVVSSGFDGCERDGSRHWNEIYDTGSWQPVALLPAGDGIDGAPVARFDNEGNIYLLAPFAPATAFELSTFDTIELPGWSGLGDVTPDGQTMVSAFSQEQVGLALNVYQRGSTSRVDLLTPMPGQVYVPTGLSISADGKYAFALSQALDTIVFDLDSGEVAFRLPGGSGTNAEFDTNRQVAYTAHFDGTVKVWDLSTETTGIEIVEDLGTADWINGDSFSIGEDLGSAVALDFGTREWFVRFFDLDTGEFVGSVPGRGATPLPGGKWAVLSPDGLVRLVEPGADDSIVVGGCLSDDDLGTCASTSLPYPFDDVLVSVERDEVVLFRGGADGFTSGEMQHLDPLTGTLGQVEVAATGFRVVEAFSGEWILGRPSGLIVAKDRHTREVLFERSTLPGVEVSPSGERAAFIDPGTGLVLLEFDGWDTTDIPVEFNRIRGMAFSPDESRLILAGIDRLYVVDLEQRAVAQVMEISGGSDAYWLSEDTFLIGTNDGIWGVGSLSTESFLRSTREGLRRSFTEGECQLYRIDPCPTLEEIRSR